MSFSGISRYQDIQKVTCGSYGTIKFAVDRMTGEKVALKYPLREHRDGLSSYVIRELSIMKELNHPNIVPLLDVIDTENSFVIVMPRFRMSLFTFIARHGILHPKLLQSYAFQLLAGLHYIHSNRILHRDIKTLNLLIDSEGRLVISDFGMARHYSVPIQQYSPEVASLCYRAPELLEKTNMYSTAADMWAAGCCIAEMATGGPLFMKADSPMALAHTIMEFYSDDQCPSYMLKLLKGTPHEKRRLADVLEVKDDLLCDLVGGLLKLDPAKRLSAREALDHPYFDDVCDKIRETCLAGLV